MTEGSSRWQGADAADYDEKWQRMADAGIDPHGEVAFVQRFEPTSVLDAGCGTGRVAIELANRGVDVVGTDLDDAMLAVARDKAPQIEWITADLSTIDIGGDDGARRTFDVVVMAGNVMIFVSPGTESAVVEQLAAHLADNGTLIAGFQLGRGYGADAFDAHCVAAGLEPVGRWATWEADPWHDSADYLVAAFSKPAALLND